MTQLYGLDVCFCASVVRAGPGAVKWVEGLMVFWASKSSSFLMSGMWVVHHAGRWEFILLL